MRLTQRTALELFRENGFDAVTVGQIADEVGMAASTLYRHFATKEAIVLWDEHDAALDKAFEKHFARHAPFQAMRALFAEEIGGRYTEDLDFQLTRVRYIYATEQLHAAAVEASFRDTAELTAGLEHFLTPRNRHAASLLAGAAMLALDAAFDRWQEDDAEKSLDTLIEEAFDTLAKLDSLT
jgi:AcrR family transcriptional regulator